MTIDELFKKFEEKGQDLMTMFGFRYVMEVSRATKKKPAYLKMAIDDRMAEMLLESDSDGPLGIPYLTVFPGTETRQFFKEAREVNDSTSNANTTIKPDR
jgi:hypothetical protein